MAVPFDRYAEVARQAGPSLRGKVVVDPSNPITVPGRVEFLTIPDGRGRVVVDPSRPITVRPARVEVRTIPDGLTAAAYQQRTLGPVRLVKAFHLICASQLDEVAARTTDRRVAVPYAGDDPDAKRSVARLIADANLVPVDAGGLADAAAIEPTPTAAWPGLLTEPEARSVLAARLAARRTVQP